MKKIVFFITASLCGCLAYNLTFAENASSKVEVTNFDDINAALSKPKVGIYSNFTDMLYNNWIDLDPKHVSDILDSEKDKKTADEQLQSSLEQSINSAINLDFSDYKIKDDNVKELASQEASDDNDTTSFKLKDYLTSIFTFNKQEKSDTNKQENMKKNAMFSADNLLGKLTYNEDEKKAANFYYRFATNLASPPYLIALGEKFKVPYVPGSTDIEETSTISINAKQLDELRRNLNADKEYRSYRMNYRAPVLLRNLYTSNLLTAIKKREPIEGLNKKNVSQAQIEYDRAHSREEDISKLLRPSEVQYRIYDQLATLNEQIYILNQYQERILITMSLQGLQNTANKNDPLTLNKIGKKIYCTAELIKEGKYLHKECEEKSSEVVSTPKI